MKPEEAIEVLSNELIVITDMIGYCRDFEKESDLALAYRVKRQEAHKIAISALKEIQQYREIGTVEECLEAREKQKPKAPKDELKINPVIDCNGAYVDADTTVYLLCPNCGEMVGIDENVDKFCRECGQAIDTENLDGMEDEENQSAL